MPSRADLIALYIVSGGFGLYTIWHVILYYWDQFVAMLELMDDTNSSEAGYDPMEHIRTPKDFQ